jgi:hypothetical protein
MYPVLFTLNVLWGERAFTLSSQDSLKRENKSENSVIKQKYHRGFQQNINLSFVHHYADFFCSNAMGGHQNLGYGIYAEFRDHT